MPYFANPDCLDCDRTYDELVKVADSLPPTGHIIVTADEFALIKREISLASKWRGRWVVFPEVRRRNRNL